MVPDAVALVTGPSFAAALEDIVEDTAEIAAAAPRWVALVADWLMWHSAYAPLLLLVLAASAPWATAGVAHVVLIDE